MKSRHEVGIRSSRKSFGGATKQSQNQTTNLKCGFWGCVGMWNCDNSNTKLVYPVTHRVRFCNTPRE